MKEQKYENASVYLIDLDKISPNPFQPRREFDNEKLVSLASSIKQYGVLQPIVLIKTEYSDGADEKVRYELIAGERRFRASKIAGLKKIPAIVRDGDHTDKEKFELAIIENIQREDLNPVDKAKAFEQLISDFKLTHAQVAEKMSKSREFVSNALRILKLPEYILDAVTMGEISEGHTRPLLMLADRKDDQKKLFDKIVKEQITVRDAEKYARSIAVEKVRKKVKEKKPEIIALEKKLEKSLGTRVHIEADNGKTNAGKVTIEYFSKDDLDKILEIVSREKNKITKNESNNISSTLTESYKNNKFENQDETKTFLSSDSMEEKDFDDDLDMNIFDDSDNGDDLYSVFDDDFDDDNDDFKDFNNDDKIEKDEEVKNVVEKNNNIKNNNILIKDNLEEQKNNDVVVNNEVDKKISKQNREKEVIAVKQEIEKIDLENHNNEKHSNETDLSKKRGKTLSEALKEITKKTNELRKKDQKKLEDNKGNRDLKSIVNDEKASNDLIESKNVKNNDKLPLSKELVEDNKANELDTIAIKKEVVLESKKDSEIFSDKNNDEKTKVTDDDFFRQLLAKRRKEREEKRKLEREKKDLNSDFLSFKRDLEQKKQELNSDKINNEKPAWSSWEEEEIEPTSGNPILAKLLKKAQEKTKK